MSVDTKRDRSKEDNEEKFKAHDTCRDGSAEVFEPP